MKSRSIFLPIAVLACAALILLGISALTRPIAAANLQRDTQARLEQLLPGSSNFTVEMPGADDEYISAVYKGETGYVIEAIVDGYANPMTVWIGVNNSGTITGLMPRDMAETAGLGQDALHSLDFLSQFIHTRGNASIGENIDALTGATVTSKAIARAVNAASAYVTGADVSSGATQWGG